MPRMETLNLSESTPRSENWLKSLFWPSIQTATDVDYLGTQGYWVCTVVAVLSFAILVFTGQAISGVATFFFYYLGGVGVRERSRYAAGIVLLMYAVGTFFAGIGIVRIIIGALLLSNMRATWIASQWKPDSEEAAPPPRLNDTMTDKFADRLPQWLWPKLRIPYYVFSIIFMLLIFVGLILMQNRGNLAVH
jgi:hypothetical protein